MSGLASGLRNDAPDSALSQRQKWRLAEIRCEEYMFVVTSRLLNMLDGLGGPAFLASAHEKEWAQPLGAAVLAVRHCGLSGWQPDECMAVEEELAAWQKLGLAKTRVRTFFFLFFFFLCGSRLIPGYALITVSSCTCLLALQALLRRSVVLQFAMKRVTWSRLLLAGREQSWGHARQPLQCLYIERYTTDKRSCDINFFSFDLNITHGKCLTLRIIHPVIVMF